MVNVRGATTGLNFPLILFYNLGLITFLNTVTIQKQFKEGFILTHSLRVQVRQGREGEAVRMIYSDHRDPLNWSYCVLNQEVENKLGVKLASSFVSFYSVQEGMVPHVQGESFLLSLKQPPKTLEGLEKWLRCPEYWQLLSNQLWIPVLRDLTGNLWKSGAQWHIAASKTVTASSWGQRQLGLWNEFDSHPGKQKELSIGNYGSVRNIPLCSCLFLLILFIYLFLILASIFNSQRLSFSAF